MNAYYVVSDHGVVGPMTGIELREAVLARIIAFDAIVGGSPKGPWVTASQAGLFDHNKSPVPHPEGTNVPRYHVRGMTGAFQGPFKLRELIGFACRGMLSLECEFQAEGSEDWRPIKMLRIIAYSLSGDLVLVDAQGEVCLRTAGVKDGAKADRWDESHRAPIKLVQKVDKKDHLAYSEADWSEDEEPESGATEVPEELRRFGKDKKANAKTDDASTEEVGDDDTSKAARWIKSISPIKVAATFLVLAMVGTGGYFWWTYKPPLMDVALIHGQWIHSDEDQPRFGITFEPDGKFVLFNASGQSFTGQYLWQKEQNAWDGGASQMRINTVVDQVDEKHSEGEIRPNDGYMRLAAKGKQTPYLDGHKVFGLFIRREEESLKIGYLCRVRYDTGEKEMIGGWVTAEKMEVSPGDVVSKLGEVAESAEAGRSNPDYAGFPDVRVAVQQARAGVKHEDKLRHGSLATSAAVNGASLLQMFGMPIEARAVLPSERPQLEAAPSFVDSQLVRYPGVTLLLDDEGFLQYLHLGEEEAATSGEPEKA